MFKKQGASQLSLLGFFCLIYKLVHGFTHDTHLPLLVLITQKQGSGRAMGTEPIPPQRAHDIVTQATETAGAQVAILSVNALIGRIHVFSQH